MKLNCLFVMSLHWTTTNIFPWDVHYYICECGNDYMTAYWGSTLVYNIFITRIKQWDPGIISILFSLLLLSSMTNEYWILTIKCRKSRKQLMVFSGGAYQFDPHATLKRFYRISVHIMVDYPSNSWLSRIS